MTGDGKFATNGTAGKTYRGYVWELIKTSSERLNQLKLQLMNMEFEKATPEQVKPVLDEIDKIDMADTESIYIFRLETPIIELRSTKAFKNGKPYVSKKPVEFIKCRMKYINLDLVSFTSVEGDPVTKDKNGDEVKIVDFFLERGLIEMHPNTLGDDFKETKAEYAEVQLLSLSDMQILGKMKYYARSSMRKEVVNMTKEEREAVGIFIS